KSGWKHFGFDIWPCDQSPRSAAHSVRFEDFLLAAENKVAARALRSSRSVSARLGESFGRILTAGKRPAQSPLQLGGPILGEVMYDALEKEIATYEKRTPKSAAAHKRALERIPLGVASNYRHYEPYPIFVKDGKGSRIHDIDGNEYVDHNLCFGALMAGHGHPAVMKAVKAQLEIGTTFGMPHDQEWELAEEICARYPVEMVRFGSSGTEVTMHACRIA